MKGTQNCHERGNYFGLNMAVALTLYNLDSMEWFLFRNIVCYTMLQWPQSRSHIHTLSSNLLISRLYQSLPILNWTSTSLISLSSSSELNPILIHLTSIIEEKWLTQGSGFILVTWLRMMFRWSPPTRGNSFLTMARWSMSSGMIDLNHLIA